MSQPATHSGPFNFALAAAVLALQLVAAGTTMAASESHIESGTAQGQARPPTKPTGPEATAESPERRPGTTPTPQQPGDAKAQRDEDFKKGWARSQPGSCWTGLATPEPGAMTRRAGICLG